MKIAIIGAGISGNVVAALLAQDHDITLFEAEHNIGGHTRTLDVRAFGGTYKVDTGFMVFNDRTYPNFCRLLRLLEVDAQDADMSFGVHCDATGLEYQGSSLGGLFAQWRNLVRPAFHGMLWDILRFNRHAPTLLESDLREVTVGELLSANRYGNWFWEKYLAPMAAAIWSCPPDAVVDFPAHFFVGFLRNHGLLQIADRPQWKTVHCSARSYLDRLTSPFRDRIRHGCPIESVWRQGQVVVEPKNAPAEVFDRVIMASHANQTLSMLKDADDQERDILSAFPYQRNVAVLHTDTSVLPRRRRAWASWNYCIPQETGAPVLLTYDLSRLQKLDTPEPILLTLNGAERIAPSKVLDRFVFHHPVYTTTSQTAQGRFGEINGRRATYFCGAYWGFGFHEDGVNSALAVANYFDKKLDSCKAVSTKESFTTSACSR